MRELILYDWKGNVRELKNIFERCFLFSQGNVLEKHVELTPVEKTETGGPWELLLSERFGERSNQSRTGGFSAGKIIYESGAQNQ